MVPLLELPLRRVVIDDGVEIHYAEAGEGPPMVFVHGGMGDWQAWAPQWAEFTARFRCISYSRRFSSPNQNKLASTDHSVRAEAKDLEQLLDRWDATPAYVVGTSYGAYTALQMALSAPAKVRALALTEPPVLPFADRVAGGKEVREKFQREVIAPADEAFRAGDIQGAVAVLTVGINGKGPGEAATAAGLERRIRNAQGMRALAFSNDAYPVLDEDLLRKFTVPTLLLTGEDTTPIHQVTMQALQELLPQAPVRVVPGCGHGVHRDNPSVLNRTVLEFFERH